MKFPRIEYKKLKSRQKENYNFQKVSSYLAEYGFVTSKLSDDWEGADFIAVHIDGATMLKVQLKSRLTFDKKYQNKNIYICFPYNKCWYLYKHDELLNRMKNIIMSNTWKEKGKYSFPKISKRNLEKIKNNKL